MSVGKVVALLPLFGDIRAKSQNIKNFNERRKKMSVFTVKGVVLEDYLDVFMAQWEYEYSQPRAFDYARKAFRDYLDKGTDDSAELAAVHLYAYLACWGMCHHLPGSIRWKNYRILIPIVKKLRGFAVDKDYEFLKDYNPYKNGIPTIADKTAYVEKVLKIVNALCGEFDVISTKVGAEWSKVQSVFEPYFGKNYKPLQYGEINDTDTLIGKILLVTLGCTVAYDSHVCAALKDLGVKRVFSESALEDFYDKVIIGGYNDVTSLINHYSAQKSANNYPDYPVMKLIDMALWAYGATIN